MSARARSSRSTSSNRNSSARSSSRNVSQPRSDTFETPKRPVIAISKEQKLLKVNLIGVVVAAIFVFGIWFLVHNDFAKLHKDEIQLSEIKQYALRAKYAFKYQTIQLFWLLTCSLFISYYRFIVFAKVTNFSYLPLRFRQTHEFEYLSIIKELRIVLANSFEHAFISCFGQLIFVSYAQPELIIKYIPLVNMLQFFGCVTYFAGFPEYRSFGFTISIIPNIALVFYASYHLGLFNQLIPKLF